MAIVSCVVKVFDATMNSVLAGSAPSSARSQVVRVDVRGEAHVERAVAQRVGEQPRAEVGAAGAEVDDAFELSCLPQLDDDSCFMRPSVSLTSAGAESPARSAVCQAARFSVLLTSLAGEQRLAPLGEAALGGEVREQAQRHRAQALARVVVAQPGRLGDELHRARDVGGEELAQVHAAPALGVLRELGPGRAVGGRAWYSFSEAVQAVALAAVAGTADVGELDPARAGPVELVLRVALHQKQRTGLRA